MPAADVIVVGGGIAGISTAAALSTAMRVILLEAEESTAYHATGRSAAAFGRSYGNAVIRRLNDASSAFFETPPAGFAEAPLLVARPWIIIARSDQREALDGWQRGNPRLERLDADEVHAAAPLLSAGYAACGLIDRGCGDLDVDALVQGWLRQLRANGGTVRVGARLAAARRAGPVWHVTAGDTRYDAPLVINAAGAWADEIAPLFGAAPLGLIPMRRTAVLIDPPEGLDVRAMPVILDAEEQFYIKPEAGKLLASPADETPVEPGDAQADEYDVAVAIDRYQTATGHMIRRVSHRWAGLRTFAPDRTPLVGPDPEVEGFFWMAGQGGYGVQIAPALSALAAGMITRGGGDPALIAALYPGRLAKGKVHA